MAMRRVLPATVAALAACLAAGTWSPARSLATAGAGVSQAAGAVRSHPRMLIGAADPFTSLASLEAKYAAGERPSDDLPGWALSYLLTGDVAYGRRAVEEMRKVRLPVASNSRP